MLKIDVDHIYSRPRFTLQKILYTIPRPFRVRLSSSGNGLHIEAPLCDTWDYRRYCFDDPMRIALDEKRQRKQLPVSNLLWDLKNGRAAGKWYSILTERDIEFFLDTFTNTYIYYVMEQTTTYANHTRNR